METTMSTLRHTLRLRSVIPAKAGIHRHSLRKSNMDSRFRGNDGKECGNDGKEYAAIKAMSCLSLIATSVWS